MTEPEDVLGFRLSTGPRTRRGHAPPPVAVLSHDDRVTTLALADHGPGMPDEAKIGLGMKLIDLLCRQIDARAAWQNDGGTRLILQVPIRVA